MQYTPVDTLGPTEVSDVNRRITQSVDYILPPPPTTHLERKLGPCFLSWNDSCSPSGSSQSFSSAPITILGRTQITEFASVPKPLRTNVSSVPPGGPESV